MNRKPGISRLETGARNFDALCQGGPPKGSVTVIAGPPGAGKTIFTQEICFHHGSAENRVLYFSTLSEPTAKTLRYLSQFTFFDSQKLDGAIQFVDLGMILRTKGLEEASTMVMEHVRNVKPAVVVIDSFRVFDDLATSKEDLRKFGYELTVNLMAWEATTFLLGEFGPRDIETNPLFSIVDGLIMMGQREQSGEQQRFLQIIKMRGTEHSRDEHTFRITDGGIEVYAPRVTIRRDDVPADQPRCKTGISRLDDLLGEGIPRGSTLLVAGVAGTGKTLLSMEFVYRGARRGEKGIIFSFEETAAKLRSTARSLGWELDAEIDRGTIELVFIPQPEIMVEKHLLMMRERVEATGARRVAVDSVSVFLHKVQDPQLAREKTFQLASIVQNNQAVGFLATDIPYGSRRISRFGVEETVVDGVILLTSTEEGLERQRYLEIYKLRNTAHSKGRHSMMIGSDGVSVFPRYDVEASLAQPSPSIRIGSRISSGVPGLDPLLGGGLLERSVTLVSGSAGIGKSTLAFQFLAAGSALKEPGLYVALEEGPEQIVETADALGLRAKPARKDLIDVIFVSGDRTRPNQLLSLLTEKIRAQKARRVVLDGVGHMASEGMRTKDLRHLVYALTTRFKSLGVTTMLTFESGELHATSRITDRQFSPLADNLIALRYHPSSKGLQPVLTVVKTRGSAHDFRTHTIALGAGGMRVGAAMSGAPVKPPRRRLARR